MHNLDMELLIIYPSKKVDLFKENNNQLSNYDIVYTYKRIGRKSQYYIAKKNNKKAIIDKNGKRIGEWFNEIYAFEFISGKSDYYIGYKSFNRKIKAAIFDKDSNQVSGWFKSIHPVGLVEGKSDYYIAVNNIGKVAVFSFSKNVQITSWHEYIGYNGAVIGLFDFIVAHDKIFNTYKIKIYNKEGEIVYSFEKKLMSEVIPCSAKGKFIYTAENKICILDIIQNEKVQVKLNNFTISLLRIHNKMNSITIPIGGRINSILKCSNCGDKYYVYFVVDDLRLCPWCDIEKIRVFTI